MKDQVRAIFATRYNIENSLWHVVKLYDYMKAENQTNPDWEGLFAWLPPLKKVTNPDCIGMALQKAQQQSMIKNQQQTFIIGCCQSLLN